MKSIAGTLRLDLAQYRSMAAFAQFASDLDKSTQFQLNRGKRMVEILKQGQYQPLSVEKQILIIFAGVRGYLDKLPIASLRRYEQELFVFIDSKRPDALKAISTGKAFETEEKDDKGVKTKKDTEAGKAVKSALEEFGKQFVPTEQETAAG